LHGKIEVLPREAPQPLPAGRRRRSGQQEALELGERLLHHCLDQLRAAGEMPIDRGRADPDLVRDPAHRERVVRAPQIEARRRREDSGPCGRRHRRAPWLTVLTMIRLRREPSSQVGYALVATNQSGNSGLAALRSYGVAPRTRAMTGTLGINR